MKNYVNSLKFVLIGISLLVINDTLSQLVFGVNGHPLTSGDYKPFSFDTQMQLLKQNGFTDYRFDVIFDQNNNIVSRNGDFQNFINSAKEYNIQLIPNIALKTLDFSDSPSLALSKGISFGKIFMERYGKYFSIIELGNENNMKIRLGNKKDSDGTPTYDSSKADVLMQYLKGMTVAIKDANTSTKIIVGIAGADSKFFQIVKNNDIAIDILGDTRYDTEKFENSNMPSSLEKMYQILKKPIWILELNYSQGSSNISNKIQAKWLSNRIAALKVSSLVQGIFIYQLLDENSNLNKKGVPPSEANYGIYKVNGNQLKSKFQIKY